VGFGDLHIGSKFYDEKKATEVRDWIKNNHCIWVGMGDFCENANKRSVGAGVYEQFMNPKEQIAYLREFLKPIAEKCIGFIRGNHEERTFKDSGVDIADIICYELSIPYCGWEFFGSVAKEKKAYTIYAVHSYSANKTAGLALNMVERDIEKMLDVDIILRGHTHKRIHQISEAFEIDSRNNAVIVKQRAIVITGHFLNRSDSYAAAKPYRGDPKGTIALELEMRHKYDKTIKPIYI